MRRPALLLILCASHADAVRLQSRGHENPTVAGTGHLEAEELEGKKPIFVDAFPDAKGTEVDVILNFSPLFGKESKPDGKEWKLWTNAKWECRWDAPILTSMHKTSGHLEATSTLVTTASIVYDTNDEPQSRTPSSFNQSTPAGERSEVFRWLHHSLVLGCPAPADLAGSNSTWHLSLVASDAGKTLYQRQGIPVARGAFVKPQTGAVLCTMVFQEDETDVVLGPWAKFHLAMGFDQILVYVEDKDPSWAKRAVAGLPDASKVTVVPFFFGNVSMQRAFHMQAGMESHCLFQARNRATWLAHADIDEYFDVLLPESHSISDYLGKLSHNTGAVMVRSQFWAQALGEAPADGKAPFPCYITCRNNSYFPNEIRTKWIGRASEIKIVNPHIVKTRNTDSMVHVGDPWKEIRLNHFRRCTPKMVVKVKRKGEQSECVLQSKCETSGDRTLDRAWTSRCGGMMKQDR